MTPLQAYLQGPEPLPNGDHTSLQRQAMDEVLHLSSAVVQPLESQIESDYRTAGQQAQERLTADQEQDRSGLPGPEPGGPAPA